MNKQQLASKIWESANKLRGKVAASDYKDYMLGFIFYKYLSDKEVNTLKTEYYFDDSELKKLTADDAKTVKSCKENLGYFISYADLFSTWIAPRGEGEREFVVGDVRQALVSFNTNIDKDFKKVFGGIFETLQNGITELGATDPERTKNLKSLLDLINDIPTDNKNSDYDVLGFIYEFLLKNFAANAGKAGEFYTPNEASTIMSEIIAHHLKDRDKITIYDPTSGSGSLLITIGKAVAKYMDNPDGVKYYAQELVSSAYNLTRMNLVMRGIRPANICVRQGDTLAHDWPEFEEDGKEIINYNPLFVDACCSNPPYSQHWDNDKAEFDVRFSAYGVAPSSKADLAFLLHNLYHLRPDGIMTIVMPHGVLFRGGEEKNIRTQLIERNHIETIIGLPANIFFGTGIPTLILVLKKNRAESDILFIDASKGFIKDGNKNKLRACDIKKIVDTAISRESVSKFSRLVSKEEVIANDYNLNIPRYIDSSVNEIPADIYATMFGGIPDAEIDMLCDYWSAFPTLRAQIFAGKDIPYSDIKTDDIRKTIEQNGDVQAFIKDHEERLVPFSEFLKTELITNRHTLKIQREETVLADKLRELLNGENLIDYYAAYELIHTAWLDISADLEIIQTEGDAAIKQVIPNMVIKKDSKTKKTYEKQEGWLGKILPFDLIQNVYFPEDNGHLSCLKIDLSDYESQKSELLESIDPADKQELLKEDSDDIDTDKLKAKITKINKDVKQGLDIEEGSYEDIILKIGKVNERISAAKKQMKALKLKIEEQTKAKIESLSDEEALRLLTKKWIEPLCCSVNNLSGECVKTLEAEVQKLAKKYSTTLTGIDGDISATERELCGLLNELEADEFDKKGIAEFKALLGDKE